jgi:hypothetical protein
MRVNWEEVDYLDLCFGIDTSDNGSGDKGVHVIVVSRHDQHFMLQSCGVLHLLKSADTLILVASMEMRLNASVGAGKPR